MTDKEDKPHSFATWVMPTPGNGYPDTLKHDELLFGINVVLATFA